MSSPRFIIAPNSLKGGLNAPQVADAIADGILEAEPKSFVIKQPIADGGEATVEILTKALHGKIRQTEVSDPLGRPIEASYGYVERTKTAIIEMCAASGIGLLKEDERNPLKTTTYGTGELINKSLEDGSEKIIIGVGGSATVDAGVGMLQALGIRFLDENNNEIGKGGGQLNRIDIIDVSGINPQLRNVELVTLCDVDNALLGKNGAANVYGPQKGASQKEVDILESNIRHFNEKTKQYLGKDMANLKHGGAAGGITAALKTYLGAKLVSGSERILELIGFEKLLKQGGVVVTAEGRLDEQTLQGKGPYGVARLAKQHDLSVVCLAGQIPEAIDVREFKLFDAIIPITTGPMTLETAISRTAEQLGLAGYEMVKLIEIGKRITS